MTEAHCSTCHCGRRAPVQGRHLYGADRNKPRGLGDGPGTISWEEHLLAWGGYARDGHGSQGADRLAERGGFGFEELQLYLGRDPQTWRPAGEERAWIDERGQKIATLTAERDTARHALTEERKQFAHEVENHCAAVARLKRALVVLDGWVKDPGRPGMLELRAALEGR